MGQKWVEKVLAENERRKAKPWTPAERAREEFDYMLGEGCWWIIRKILWILMVLFIGFILLR
jgi:hypothetical protein